MPINFRSEITVERIRYARALARIEQATRTVKKMRRILECQEAIEELFAIVERANERHERLVTDNDGKATVFQIAEEMRSEAFTDALGCVASLAATALQKSIRDIRRTW